MSEICEFHETNKSKYVQKEMFDFLQTKKKKLLYIKGTSKLNFK